jgi:hypothetical protein
MVETMKKLDGRMKQSETTYANLHQLGYEKTSSALLKMEQTKYGSTGAYINGMADAIEQYMKENFGSTE